MEPIFCWTGPTKALGCPLNGRVERVFESHAFENERETDCLTRCEHPVPGQEMPTPANPGQRNAFIKWKGFG